MKFRASQLGKLMTSSRTKGEALGQTAKSYIIEQAKQDFYDYKVELTNKYVMKGIHQEQDSIDLLNAEAGFGIRDDLIWLEGQDSGLAY